MLTEEELLKRLDDAPERDEDDDYPHRAPPPLVFTKNAKQSDAQDTGDELQWQVRSNGYFPCGKTAKILPAGNYWPQVTGDGIPYLQLRSIICDDIVEMPDSISAKVIEGIQTFWTSKAKYEKFGLMFKRGILLWGPPGSGKSVTVRLLSKQILEMEGLVIHGSTDPAILLNLLRSVRTVEPERAMIIIFEDIDEIINNYGEHSILSLLDGESQIENVVFVGTTNYLERLGARIVNRPSRFDERIFVGMPTDSQRRHYLTKMAPNCDMEKWIKDTAGMSIAHIRELVAAVYCLEFEYEFTLKRLKTMQEKEKDSAGFNERSVGFTK